MIDIVARILFWVTVAVTVVGGLSIGLALRKIWKVRDGDYEREYRKHLEQRHRVEEGLRKARENGN